MVDTGATAKEGETGSSSEKSGMFVRRSSGLLREMNAKYSFSINVMSAGFFFSFMYLIWGQALFPGANLGEAALFGILLNLPIAFVYYYFTVIMPRSGGDYIWISRTVMPIVGFVLNLGMVFALLIWMGAEWPIAIQNVIAPLLYNFGTIFNNPSLISYANDINNTSLIVTLTIVWLLINGFIITRKAKTVGRLMLGYFIVALIALVTYLGAMLYLGHTGFVTNFNKNSGMNYASLLALGSTLHYPLNSTLSATLFSTVYIYLNFLGVVFTAYYSGEVKSIQKTGVYSIIGTTIAFGLLLFLIYSVTYSTFGFGFIQTVASLSGTGNPALTYPYAPFPNVLAVLGMPNPIIGTMISIGFLVTLLGAVPAYLFISTRNLFAYSFDRIIPTFFSKVGRSGAPYGSAILITIIGAITSILYITTTAFLYLLYSADLMLIIYAVIGAVAIYFPFTKKSIFESAPGFIKKKIGAVPVMSIIGVLACASATYGVVASFIPSLGGAIMTPVSIASTFVIYIIGIIVYAIAHFYRKSKGLPLEYSFKEIPPL